MANRNYLNFDLLLEQEAEGRYQARVTDSPLGETPSVRFQLPFDATTLENLLLKLDPGRSGTRRTGGTSQQQAAMDFGGPLYQAVFTGDLALAWQRSLDTVRAEQAGGLRLRLRLNDAPAIAGLPWELLYDARTNSFLAQSERTPVVRFLDVPQVPRPIAVDGPLRVLAIISSPTDLEELDVEAEWRRITEALAPRVEAGSVVLDRLPSATLDELRTWLRRNQTHVIHFVGHGDFDDRLGEGVVYFQDVHGRSSPVTSSVLGPYLRDHDPLRMVVLNACRSARSEGVDPFAGMAQGLVQQDATAVVAMQFPISDRAAVKFTGEFYGSLVDGLPVDQAVSSARKALLADFRDEWATPVLFLRSPDGNIFENVHADPGALPVPVAAPVPMPSTSAPVPAAPTPDPAAVTRAAQAADLTPEAVAGSAGTSRAKQLRLIGVGVAAVAAALALVFVLGNVLGDGDGTGKDEATDGPTTSPSSPLVNDEIVDLHLPKSGASLTDTQVLLSAGGTADAANAKVWRIDLDPTKADQDQQITRGNSREWLPSLSPDRRTMVYSRLKKGTARDYELFAGGARLDEDGDALFPDLPRACGRNSGRPTWSKTAPEPFLVMLCRDSTTNTQSLLSVGLESGRLDPIPVQAPDEIFGSWGDPALSPDGQMVVVFTAEGKDLAAGALWAVTLVDEKPHLLLDAADRVISDPVFSPTDPSVLAYRVNLDPDLPPADADLDIVIARLDGFEVVDRVSVTVDGALMEGTQEEDPSFSPDGTEIVFTSDKTSLWRADVSTGEARRVTLPGTVPQVHLSVPAWASR